MTHVRNGAAATARCLPVGPVPPRITNSTEWLHGSCHTPLNGEQLYAQQDLYTIYVHRSPEAAPMPAGSIFTGRDIANRCAPPAAHCDRSRRLLQPPRRPDWLCPRLRSMHADHA